MLKGGVRLHFDSFRIMSSYAQQPKVPFKQKLASLLKWPSVFVARRLAHPRGRPGPVGWWPLCNTHDLSVTTRAPGGSETSPHGERGRFTDAERSLLGQRWKTVTHSSLTSQRVSVLALVPLLQVPGTQWAAGRWHFLNEQHGASSWLHPLPGREQVRGSHTVGTLTYLGVRVTSLETAQKQGSGSPCLSTRGGNTLGRDSHVAVSRLPRPSGLPPISPPHDSF